MYMYSKYFKRIFDLIISLMAITFLGAFMVIISVRIKLESKGPILFKQRRVGKGGNEFTIYKFRSMRTGTPNVATDKLMNTEQYVTKLGKVIRKTSLDEIPQLINILKGDMSIVGPRPALYNQYELIAARDTVKVNSLRPGLTGYAQVKGRDFITDEEKVRFDLYYLENVSFMLDVKIIFMTFYSVIQSEGVKG
jgi:O-antigen biosynthesis protein WbqP